MLKNHRIVPPPLGMVPAGRGLTATIGFTLALHQWGED